MLFPPSVYLQCRMYALPRKSRGLIAPLRRNRCLRCSAREWSGQTRCCPHTFCRRSAGRIGFWAFGRFANVRENGHVRSIGCLKLLVMAFPENSWALGKHASENNSHSEEKTIGRETMGSDSRLWMGIHQVEDPELQGQPSVQDAGEGNERAGP